MRSDRVGRRWRLTATLLIVALWWPLTMVADELPDIVLVTLDTTRADRLGCYGDASARTPVLDGLAAGGARFTRALTASPLTLPAHASLMTGVDPPGHGLHDNGLAALGGDLPTLAQRFREGGYSTGAVVASGVLDHRFGLDRGFDHYDDALNADHLGEYGYPERDAAAVTRAGLEWVGSLEEESPWFLWVHYYDPHSPYLPGPDSSGTEEQRYAAEITRVDHQLGLLLEGLPGDPSGRLIAVVGDHGEMLGEHGERAHGLLLYRASLEVPLLLSGPGVTPGGVVEGAVASKRLGATLAHLAGLEVSGLGNPLPGLSDPTVTPQEPVYSETWLPATAYGWSPMHAVSSGRWRYVEAPRPELFDFVADPAESHNLIDEQPDRAEELGEMLRGLARTESLPTTRALADQAQLQADVRALGYLSGMTGATAGAIDPKDGIVWLDEFEMAKRSMAAGDTWDARRRLDALVRRNPGNVPFLMRAASAHFITGSRDRGFQLLEKALEINPALDLLHLTMGQARLEVGDLVRAEASFRAAVELNPRLAAAWLGLAQLAVAAGDGAQELRELEAAAQAGTRSGVIEARLGQLALSRGDHQAASAHLRSATELAPGLSPAWWSWGETAEGAGKIEAAVERYRRALELNPGDPRAFVHVGRLLQSLERVDEARAMFSAAIRLAPGSEAAGQARALLAGGAAR